MTPLSKPYFDHYNSAFDAIYIHPESTEHQVAKRMAEIFPEKIRPFSEAQKITEQQKGSFSSGVFSESKKRILIQPHKGQFFKQCPGGNAKSACCNYFVLNLGSQCHFDCSYCYLQSFLNTPFMVVYSNLQDALSELTDISARLANAPSPIRIGTGEVIDSLGLDPLTGYSETLIQHIGQLKNLSLELKTKSHFVDHLLDIENPEHKSKTTFSWSINPELIVSQEEHGTASLAQRLEAAQKAKQAGYRIGFHIDPVIWHPEWKENYQKLVNDVVKRFEPSDVPYISLGALRFQPEQRHIMKARFSRASLVNQAELFKSKDGKLRYDSQLRSEMFKFIIDAFKAHSRLWSVFLCMETPETWLSTYGEYPMKVEGLGEVFRPAGLVR